MRKPPPDRYESIRQKAKIYTANGSPTSIYIDVGVYEDGRPCSVFLDVRGDGSTERALYASVARMISTMLQYGVPAEEIIEMFLTFKFEPGGPVQGHPRIKFCTSVLDLVVRHIGVEFCGMDHLAHVPKELDQTEA
jgi:ribonucleoside-diphosphate reductase alpha chain